MTPEQLLDVVVSDIANMCDIDPEFLKQKLDEFTATYGESEKIDD